MYFNQLEFEYILECIHDDEILIVPNMEDSLWQKDINKKVKQQMSKEVPFVQTRNPFVGWFRNFFQAVWPQVHHRAAAAFHEGSLQHPMVFVLHQRGLPLPEQYLEKVPPNTILIAVSPGDYPEYNCFEAKPIPLERLKQESQHVESMHSKPLDAS